MVYFMCVLGSLTLLTGSLWLIAATLRDNINAVVQALVGRPDSSVSAPLPPMLGAGIVRLSDYRRSEEPLRKAA